MGAARRALTRGEIVTVSDIIEDNIPETDQAPASTPSAPFTPSSRPGGGGGGGGGRPGGGRPGGDQQRRPKRPGGKDRFAPRRKVCQFCVDKVRVVDYKDFNRLKRYLSDRGKIEPRRKTGTCARHQRSLTVAIKRSRFLALLPYVSSGR